MRIMVCRVFPCIIQALDDLGGQLEVVYGLFMHEIIHALGFSSRLFDKYTINVLY